MPSLTCSRILLGALCAALMSCATTPVATDAAKEVPGKYVLNPAMLVQKPGLGQVVVKRDKGMNTGACRSRIFANGEPVADIAPGEKVTLYLPPGEQMLAAKATSLCSGGLVETSAAVSESGTATFRVSYGSKGEFSIQPTAF